MTIKPHEPEPSRRIQALAKSHSGYVAVAFLGKAATTLLPLREGGMLVTRAKKNAVKAGLVDPREGLKLLRRGVRVHDCAHLHAKVFVFGSRAMVGSAHVGTLGSAA